MKEERAGELGGDPRCTLRRTTGADEFSVSGDDSAAAIALLERLVSGPVEGVSMPSGVAGWPISTRDRVLSRLYQEFFGDAVEFSTACKACAEKLEVSFSISDALAERTMAGAEDVDASFVGEGWFELSSGTRFRLPTGEDELAVQGRPNPEAEQALLERCAVLANPADRKAVETAMERVAPLCVVDLVARCPYCAAIETLEFDLQAHLLSRLLRERGQLLWEVHRLASAYGWSLEEILSLRRDERSFLTTMVELAADAGGNLG